MADWKKRGYVPDSDDEEEEGLEPLSQYGPSTGTIPGTGRDTEDPGLANQEKSLLSVAGPQHHLGLIENILPTGERYCDPIRSKDESGGALQRVEAEQICSVLGENEAQKDASPQQGSKTINNTQSEEAKSSVAEQLQNQLESGLEIIKKVLSGSSTPVGSRDRDSRSDLSSPLSSAESFPVEDHPGTHFPDAALETPFPLVNRSPNHHFVEVAVNVENATQGTRRNLRHRNPIQLHPYALEGARYQQELLARGVRPVYLAGLHRRRTSEVCETEDSDNGKDNACDNSSNITSSEQESSGPLQPIHNEAVRRCPRRHCTDAGASDEELPDLDAILEGKHARLLPKKRSKGLYSARQTSKSLDYDNGFHVDDLSADSAAFISGGSASGAIFHVPPSPPHTRSIQSSQSSETLPKPLTRHSFTRRRAPQALPTPNISSASQQPAELPLHLDDESEPPDNRVADSSSTASPQSIEQGHRQIIQLQRKTKGVLPASFFRLRGQQQDARSKQVRRWCPSPGRDPDVPGVARSLFRPGNLQTSPSRASNNAVMVSDDPSDEGSVMESLDNSAAPNLTKGYDNMMQLGTSDIEEDNGIDMMIQPRTRKRKLTGLAKDTQRRINEFYHDGINHSRTDRAWRSSKRRRSSFYSEARGQRRKPKTSMCKAPPLGPLDAPGYTNLPRVEQPNFLRVAARCARSSKTTSRQTPSRKSIRLARSADTYEANIELNNWRKGLTGQNDKGSPSAALRRSMQWHNLQLNNPLERGFQHAVVSHSGQNHVPWKINSRKLSQVEHPPPQPHRTDDVVRDTVLRHTGKPNPSSNPSRITFQRVSDDDTPGPPQPSAPVHVRYGNRSGRGTLLSSTIDFAKPREAQLESTGQLKTRDRILSAFRGRLASPQPPATRNAATVAQTKRALPRHVKGSGDDIVKDATRQTFSRALRKRPPRKVDVTSQNPVWRPEPSGQAANADSDDLDALSGVVLPGLGSPDFPITNNFGVLPLQEGSRLPETSFIGQGQLAQIIGNVVCQQRSLMQSTNDVFVVTRPSMASSSYRWGAWDDQVFQQFSAWHVELRGCLDSQNLHDYEVAHNQLRNVVAAIKSLICYLSCQASFRDRQGLISFAKIATSMSQELVQYVEIQIKSSPSTVFRDLLNMSDLLLVFIFEIAYTVASAFVNHELQTEVCKTFKALALAVLKAIFREDHLAKLVSRSSPASNVFSIGHDCPEIDVLVAINTLSKQTVLHIDMWDLITEALLSSIGLEPENLVTFQAYDSWWEGVFLALPWLELDASGVVQRRSGLPGWDLVQRLLVRFLQLFMPRRHNTGYSTKRYGRILIQRCFDLVQVWGWQGGHSAIGSLFDAYTNNGMNELFGESSGNHFYLPGNLAPQTRVHIEETDSGFHAFLGLIAQTILDSRKPDADPKLAKRVLRSLSARLVPAKGDDLPRYRNPRHSDIMSLKNRFDLVSVLYRAMPADMKPNLRLLQSFVDFRNAHREACKVALECWSQLVQHEVLDERSAEAAGHTALDDDRHTTLLLFREWHDSIVTDLLVEYTSKNHEALEPVEYLPTADVDPYNILCVPRTPVAEVLRVALIKCEQSIAVCQTTSQATALLSQRMLWDMLRLYDSGRPTTDILVCAALQIVRAYTRNCASRTSRAVPADEDSQEYGSWDHFEVMDNGGQSHKNSDQAELTCLLHEVQPVLRRFLSNVFGSDIVPSHAILMSTADCWYEIADALVSSKVRSWEEFMDQYSTDSWESLRHTQQSQQYKIYFLVKILDSDHGFYVSNCLRVLKIWLCALCRPKDLVYWEHLLTSSILFRDPENELLFNPPFAVRSAAGKRLEISMDDFCEGRKAMIYVVLRNMHRLLASSVMLPQPSHLYNKQDFCEMLKNIESTMKSFYEDLETDQQKQDDYRVFISFVIQQMQLYVVDFYKVDPFFTDPAIFSTESYAITAALKRYSLSIETTGVTKAMVLFLYNASERAAINDSQDEFLLQLNNALLDLSQEAIERTENHECDSVLLTLFLQNVFPAYVAHAFSEPGHIIARPLLQILTYIYQNLRCRPDLWNPSFIQRFIIVTEVSLRSAVNAFQDCEHNLILESFERLQIFDEIVVFIHAAMLRMYEATQRFPNDIDPGSLIETLLILKDHILAVERPPEVDSYSLDIEGDQNAAANLPAEHPPIRAYAEKELQNALHRTWRRGVSGGWEIIGRGAPKAVKASRRTVSDVEMEACRQRTRFVVREFMEAFVRLDWWE